MNWDFGFGPLIFFFGGDLSCNSVNEARVESSDSLKNGDKTKSLTQSMSSSSSSKQQGLETALNEQTPGRASDFAFSSMPTMHINEQVGSGCGDADDDVGGRTFSKSCPEPISLAGSSKVCIDGFFPFHQVEGFARKELFAPYWPIEAVNKALEVCSKMAPIIYFLLYHLIVNKI